MEFAQVFHIVSCAPPVLITLSTRAASFANEAFVISDIGSKVHVPTSRPKLRA